MLLLWHRLYYFHDLCKELNKAETPSLTPNKHLDPSESIEETVNSRGPEVTTIDYGNRERINDSHKGDDYMRRSIKSLRN